MELRSKRKRKIGANGDFEGNRNSQNSNDVSREFVLDESSPDNQPSSSNTQSSITNDNTASSSSLTFSEDSQLHNDDEGSDDNSSDYEPPEEEPEEDESNFVGSQQVFIPSVSTVPKNNKKVQANLHEFFGKNNGLNLTVSNDLRRLFKQKVYKRSASFDSTVSRFITIPSISNKLYFLCDKLFWSDDMTFEQFVASIIYIGMGTVLRPFDHIVFAHQKKILEKQFESLKLDPIKEDRILNIWNRETDADSPDSNQVAIVRITVKSQEFSKFCEYASILNFQLKTGLTNKVNGEKKFVPKGMDEEQVKEFGAQFLLESFNHVMDLRREQLKPTESHLNVEIIDVKESDFSYSDWTTYPSDMTRVVLNAFRNKTISIKSFDESLGNLTLIRLFISLRMFTAAYETLDVDCYKLIEQERKSFTKVRISRQYEVYFQAATNSVHFKAYEAMTENEKKITDAYRLSLGRNMSDEKRKRKNARNVQLYNNLSKEKREQRLKTTGASSKRLRKLFKKAMKARAKISTSSSNK